MTIRFLILALAIGRALGAETPIYVRVWSQYIEVPHPTLGGWLNGGTRSGHEIHSEALKLAKGGGAKIIETTMVICRCGQRATIETIREEIYPTGDTGAGSSFSIGNAPGPTSGISFPVGPFPEQRGMAAFETRNTGVTIEVEPTIGSNETVIDLRLIPEIVTPLRLETMMEHRDQWGDASLRMPIFETWRSNVSLSLISGKFELASVITPIARVPSPLIPKRILLFVRADLVPLPVSEP